MAIDTKKYVREALVDHFIGPKLGENPTEQEIERVLEEYKSRIQKLESENSMLENLVSENSELAELVSENKETIKMYEPIVNRLENALRGEPLYKKSYLEYRKNVQKIFDHWNLRKKYGLL